MRRILILLLLTTGLFSCKNETVKTGEDPTRFPDTINNTMTERHERIPGSRVYVISPESFSFDMVKNQLRKSDTTFVQVVETPQAKFSKAKEAFTRENLEAQGGKVDILRPIRINELDAIYMDGPATIPDRRKAMIIMGDDDFVCLMVAEYPATSTNDRTEILDIFRTIVYDKDQSPSGTDTPVYDFDLSITGFKPAIISDAVNIYNLTGNPEDERVLPTSINFAPLPILPDAAQRQYFEQLIAESQQSPLQVKPAKPKKTTINGMPAMVVETTVSSEGQTGIFYAAILNGPNSAMVFISSAFDRPQLRIQQFKKTVQSFRFIE